MDRDETDSRWQHPCTPEERVVPLSTRKALAQVAHRSPPTPKAPTTAEFLNIAMITLPSGGTRELRKAWGSTT